MISGEALLAMEREKVKRKLEPFRYREMLAVRWLVILLGSIALGLLIAIFAMGV